MPSRNIIRVSEFEKLYYDDKRPFKQTHWEALCHYLENVNRTGENRIEYFRILNRGIQFTNYVGVIQAGDLTIEVLPKVDKDKTTATNETVEQLEQHDKETSKRKQTWHNVLLQMLRECKLLRVNHVDYANLNLKCNSILEVYLNIFLNEAKNILHEGLIKKYKKSEGNKLALKGQLLFSKNISINLIHKERFYVRHSEYSQNNIFNQILYKTILLIRKISNSPWLSDKVNRLLLDFPELPDVKVTSSTFQKLIFDRKTERYKEAILISKMLLLNYRPDITGGNENVIAILFDMNKLWEEFVYRRLKKEELENNISVQRQQSKQFWQRSKNYVPRKIRPDIVLKDRRGTEKTIIIDTKWKTLQDLTPSDEDLKQMFVYNLYWKCHKSILLYPASTSDSAIGDYRHHEFCPDPERQCAIETVSVLNESESGLNKNFGEIILKTILQIK